MISSSTTIADAQSEMRFAYYGGASGMFTSSMVWVVAGFVAWLASPKSAIWALFIGGMLIHPVSVLLIKGMGRPGNHTPGNPFGFLALESTVWLVLSLPLAYIVSLFRLEWFFPAMLFVISGRYFSFSTMFGHRVFWACGAALVLAGYVLVIMNASPPWSAFTGAGIEAVFAAIIFASARRASAA